MEETKEVNEIISKEQSSNESISNENEDILDDYEDIDESGSIEGLDTLFDFISFEYDEESGEVTCTLITNDSYQKEILLNISVSDDGISYDMSIYNTSDESDDVNELPKDNTLVKQISDYFNTDEGADFIQWVFQTGITLCCGYDSESESISVRAIGELEDYGLLDIGGLRKIFGE